MNAVTARPSRNSITFRFHFGNDRVRSTASKSKTESPLISAVRHSEQSYGLKKDVRLPGRLSSLETTGESVKGGCLLPIRIAMSSKGSLPGSFSRDSAMSLNV